MNKHEEEAFNQNAQWKEESETMELSSSQMGVFLDQVEDPDSCKYNITLAWTFPAQICAEKLAEAFLSVMEGHQAFHIGVSMEKGIPKMVRIHDRVKAPEIIKTTEAEYRNIKNSFTKPYCMDGGFMYRTLMVQTEDCLHLILDIHHMFFDGTSLDVLQNELKRVYEGGECVREEVTPFLAGSSDASFLKSDMAEENYKFFESYLEENEVPGAPLPDLCNKEHSGWKNIVEGSTTSDWTEVEQFIKKEKITENSFFSAAFAIALSKFSALDNVTFASVSNGRITSDLANTIGMFVQTFPVCISINQDDNTGDFLRYVRERVRGAMKHCRLSFAELSRRTGATASVKFVYQKGILENFCLDGFEIQPELVENESAMGDMDFSVYKQDGHYKIKIESRRSIYSRELMESFLDAYITIVEGLLKENTIKDINPLSAMALGKLDDFNNNDVPYDEALDIVQIYKAAALANADNTAVFYNGKRIKYKEFDDITDRIAAFIISKGLGKNDFIPVIVGRNEYMAISTWGIIKSGAAYQPLDPSYPSERLNFMVKDSGGKLLICDREYRDILTEFEGEVLFTDEIMDLPENAGGLKADITPENPLIIIYTSGTTGTPKGCVLNHKNIVCLYYNHTRICGINEKSRIASYASFGFDAGMMELLTTAMSGASVYIMPEEIRLDLGLIDRYYIENEITHGFMTTQVGRMFAQMTKCGTLQALLLGGEKLVPFNPPENIRVINGYGPSESTAYVTSFRVKDDSPIQPIGRAHDNTKLYVVDKNNRRVPIGAPGELCVSGNQVSPGYLGRPEKTAECFVENPFCQMPPYERMYRTGDMVRILPDGNLDYVGRGDGQVKVRGFRIELTEVEQVILSFPGIKNAAVVAADDANGGKFLAAYVVSDGAVSVAELNAFIEEQKPAYMVPKVTMQIDSIPLNVNGKVDRKKLPAPEIREEKIVPPENELQEKLLEIVKGIIGFNDIGINTDLFRAGLTSIGCISLSGEIQDEFSVPMQTKDLKKAGNVEALSEYIEKMSKAVKLEAHVPARAEYDDYPLTKTQEGIFVECISRPGSTIYNIPLLLKIDDSIDLSRLRSAIVSAVYAHSYMCTELFYDGKGRVRQKRPSQDCFGRNDIRQIKGESIDKLISGLVKPFGLINERLFRIALIEAKGKYIFIDAHHIICDGTSINILLEDIGRAYEGEKLRPEEYTGFDKAQDEQKARNSTEYDDASDYYADLLGGYEMTSLPRSDMHGGAEKGSGSIRFTGMTGLADRLAAYAASNGTSANAVLCSAFGYTLAAYNGTGNALFTTVHSGRGDSQLRRTFSMLVKTLPVVYEPKTDNIAESIRGMGEQLLESTVNDIFSFAEISHDFGIKSDIMLVFQGDGFELDSFCGRNCSEIPLQLSEEKAPYVCQVALRNGEINYVIDYDAGMFTEAFAVNMAKSFEQAVSEFITRERFSEVELAGADRLEELDRFNRTEMPYDESGNVAGIFKDVVRENAGKDAVFFNGKNYSYGELDDYTDRLAAYLRKIGIGRDDFVPVLVGRNEYMAICSLGVVKAGAAYQPLDPTYPAERLNFMVSDSKARLLICDRNYRDIIVGFEGEVLCTDEIMGLPEAGETFEKEISPDDALVIIYTSGTTGTPKGCVLEHRNIVCFHHNHCRIMGIDGTSRVANYASFGFDAGVMDIFTTLMAGATLYIIPEDIRLDLALVDEFYVENGITHGFMTTQVGRMFAENTKCTSLKAILLGGEKLVPFNPPCGFRVINGYGPSECIAYVAHYVVSDDSSVQPIGTAHGNTKLYVVDKYNHRLPQGACGELCIAGNQVARGYLGRPEKTRESFVPNPFSSQGAYGRMYKTGDVVRMLPDGNYEYIGREDGQVKIRGFRVELTEVEQVIRSFTGVRNATVQAFDSPAGGKMLVAYVTGDSKIDIDDLNGFIGSQKPDYMIPKVTMQIEEIPLTPNGKVDKRKLPVPDLHSDGEGLEPENPTEEAICRIYGEILGLEKVYADDDFFRIGGTSISALQLVVRLENEGFKAVYKNLFENTTPRQLADFITGSKGNKDFFAPTGEDAKKYDYSPLEYNVVKNIPNIKTSPVGRVLLTGATGFLGSHVLEYLLDNTDSHIICIVREKAPLTAKERLETMLNFYFEKDLDEGRITVLPGDLTDASVAEKLDNMEIDTILNCAADVRHFGNATEMMRNNFDSLDTLIKLTKEKHAMLVHASSISVSGESVNGHIPQDRVFKENDLNIGQSLENMYCRTKYLAEQKIIDEIAHGMRGKIVRFGNLMARTPDGEFQINAGGNGFLQSLKGYAALGCYPIDMLDMPIEFTPIDYAAKAMVLLAGTPDKFTVFHAYNCHHVHMANVFEVMNRVGIKIDYVESDKFHEIYIKGRQDPKVAEKMSGIMAYMNDAEEKPAEVLAKADYVDENEGERKTMERVKVRQSEDYTTKALYRLGFSWPLVDYDYLERLLEIQKENGFFD